MSVPSTALKFRRQGHNHDNITKKEHCPSCFSHIKVKKNQTTPCTFTGSLVRVQMDTRSSRFRMFTATPLMTSPDSSSTSPMHPSTCTWKKKSKRCCSNNNMLKRAFELISGVRSGKSFGRKKNSKKQRQVFETARSHRFQPVVLDLFSAGYFCSAFSPRNCNAPFAATHVALKEREQQKKRTARPENTVRATKAKCRQTFKR